MKRLSAIVLLVTAFASALAQGKPNIILVMSDDQGYGEFSCHGNPVVRTPHLDRLHDQSVRFTSFHVAPMQQRDVAAEHPDIAAALRSRLEAWWQGCGPRANEPQPVIIGNDAEDPAMLTACEWWSVFVDQQGQVRRGEMKNGMWHLVVDRAGNYEFELRRWPREAALSLAAAAPAATLTDGRLPPGRAIPIAQARLRVAGTEHIQPAGVDAQHVTFRLSLPQGPTTMEATFLDAAGKPLLGAYYVYVPRLSPPNGANSRSIDSVGVIQSAS